MAEVVFYSSGSTGEPKRIVRRLEELETDAAALAEKFRGTLGAADAFVATIREEHLYGKLWRDLVPKALGVPVDPAVVISVEQLVELAAKYGRMVFLTTPSFLEKALAHPDFASLRGAFTDVVTSGGALRRETALAVRDALGVAPLEIYGSTESGTVAWRRQDAGSAANVMDGVSVALDATGRLVITASPYSMEVPFTMGDNARLVDDRRFELLGRADRLVKILEEFVSLTAVERAFESHPFIASARAETVGEAVPRLGLLAVLSAAGREALAGGTFAALTARLRADLRSVTGAAAFPRRIRFVRALPVNGRGKTTAADVRAALAAGCREPAVMSWAATAASLSAELAFPPDCECFDGHFPGYPVLPGVAQLYFVRHFARQNFPDFPDAGTYSKLKFRRLVRPHERVSLAVSRKGEGAFSFTLDVGGEIAASGTLTGGASC